MIFLLRQVNNIEFHQKLSQRSKIRKAKPATQRRPERQARTFRSDLTGGSDDAASVRIFHKGLPAAPVMNENLTDFYAK